MGRTAETSRRITRVCRAIVAVAAAGGVGLTLSGAPASIDDRPADVIRPAWSDLPALVQTQLASHGVEPARLPSFLDEVERDAAARVRDGDWDALVYYALQSRRLTSLPPVEPALSAREHHTRLASANAPGASPGSASASLGSASPSSSSSRPTSIPPSAEQRLAAVVRAIEAPPRATDDERLTYFRSFVTQDADVASRGLAVVLRDAYGRAMRFLYEKEFDAPADPAARAQAFSTLYQHRAYSTDTEVEAGYAVAEALGMIRVIAPDARLARVLIVGPGLTLARRTGFIDEIPPQSYQPWAVLNDVVSLGFSRLADIEIVCADINPRVVDHLERGRRTPSAPATPFLLVSDMPDTPAAPLSDGYRRYFGAWGRAIGEDAAAPPLPPLPERLTPHLRRAVRVTSDARGRVRAFPLNIVTQRERGAPYDAVIVTNVLTYFDDVSLLLALSNIASMLRPGGFLIHNESRDVLGTAAPRLGLPITHTRTVIFTPASGGARALYDLVGIHRKPS